MEFDIYNQRDLICNENKDENFSNIFEEKLLAKFGNLEDVDKIKIQIEDYNDDNYKGKWMVAPERFVLSYENQKNQYNNANNIRYKITTVNEHYQKYTEMFEKTDNFKLRKIFSSYSLDSRGGNGFPNGKSDSSHLTKYIKEG